MSEKENKVVYREAVENVEAKEKQMEEAEKKMAAKERVEVISKEVKSTKQQIQNIMLNMQSVVKAVSAIRAQLQLAQDDDNIPSVRQDERTLNSLKRKLAGLYGEIKDLKAALLVEESKNVREERNVWSEEKIELEARKRVEEMLKRLGPEEK